MSVSSIMAAAGMPVGGIPASFLLAVSAQNYQHFNPGGTARSGVRVHTDRGVDQRTLDAYGSEATYLTVDGTPADYEVRATLDSGALTGGTTGSYLALSSSREWYCEGAQSANLTIDIRRIAETSDAISFTVALLADDSPI